MNWRVFDDRKYPYDGGESKDLVSEPRSIAAFNADGDQARDLAVISHDRLVLYLGKDPLAAGSGGGQPAAPTQAAAPRSAPTQSQPPTPSQEPAR